MFSGFSPETIDFLWGLRFNNNREWFNEHKQTYQNVLLSPMKELTAELTEAFPIEGAQMKLSRIYRDMRMNPPVPYKESLWICLRPYGGSWMGEPSFFFELSPEVYSYGFLYWGPKAAAMERFRKQLAEQPEPFLRMIKKVQRDTGLVLSGDTYARPKPCDDPRLEPYFKLRSLLMYHTKPVDELLFSPALLEELCANFNALLPLYRYCQSFT